MTIISELKNDVAVLQANLKQSHEDLHVEKEHYKWATTRVCKKCLYLNTSCHQHTRILPQPLVLTPKTIKT